MKTFVLRKTPWETKDSALESNFLILPFGECVLKLRLNQIEQM